jgi:hypothetical protein
MSLRNADLLGELGLADSASLGRAVEERSDGHEHRQPSPTYGGIVL